MIARPYTSDLGRLWTGRAYDSQPQLAGFWGDLWGAVKGGAGAVWDVVTDPAKLLTIAAAAAGAAVGIPPQATLMAIGAVRTAVAQRGGVVAPMTIEIDGVPYNLTAEQVAAMAGDVARPQEDTIAGIPTTYVVIAGAGVVLYLVLRK